MRPARPRPRRPAEALPLGVLHRELLVLVAGARPRLHAVVLGDVLGPLGELDGVLVLLAGVEVVLDLAERQPAVLVADLVALGGVEPERALAAAGRALQPHLGVATVDLGLV